MLPGETDQPNMRSLLASESEDGIIALSSFSNGSAVLIPGSQRLPATIVAQTFHARRPKPNSEISSPEKGKTFRIV